MPHISSSTIKFNELKNLLNHPGVNEDIDELVCLQEEIETTKTHLTELEKQLTSKMDTLQSKFPSNITLSNPKELLITIPPKICSICEETK